MVRELKFRAWEKSSKTMIYDVQDVSRKRIIGESACESFQEVIDSWEYEVMQYTGLKAKNGEIYEGDIIRDNDSFLWEVYWEDGSFYAKGGEYELSEHLIEFIPDWCEVIGNIYEHPHLLEVQHD